MIGRHHIYIYNSASAHRLKSGSPKPAQAAAAQFELFEPAVTAQSPVVNASTVIIQRENDMW